MNAQIRDTSKRRPAIRAQLMAGVAILFGLGIAVPFLPDLRPLPAYADTQSVGQVMPSFADIVERVRPAVVSVKVKVEATADSNDEEGGMMIPDLPPGHPLEKFLDSFVMDAAPEKMAQNNLVCHKVRGFSFQRMVLS